jgi:hypothetical protein
MIRRGWIPDPSKHLRPGKYWADDREWVALPAADFDRMLALLEECADELDFADGVGVDRRPDLPRRVRALLKEVGDG